MISFIWYFIVSFGVTFLFAPVMIIYLRSLGLTVKDMAKYVETLIPISGGIIVLMGTFCSLMLYVFITTFFDKNQLSLSLMLASLLSILLVTIIGFMDDLLKRKSGTEYIGLKRWQKPLLTLPAVIPLMAVKAGTTIINVPLFGALDLGILYPLIILPLGFLGASNMVNMLEGFNGIAAGMGVIYTTSLGLYAVANQRTEAAVIAFAVAGALLAFLWFNFVPAKVLPGDSLTYLLGASLATIAIIGNMEKAAVIVSIPFFIEFFLKLRGNFQVQTYGVAQADGTIRSREPGIYSLPHVLTQSGNYTERQIVLAMMGISLFFSLLIWVI